MPKIKRGLSDRARRPGQADWRPRSGPRSRTGRTRSRRGSPRGRARRPPDRAPCRGPRRSGPARSRHVEDMGGIRHQPVAFEAAKAPEVARDLPTQAVRLVPDRQARIRRIQGERRIAARVAPHEGGAPRPLPDDELRGDRAGDRRAGLGRDRQLDLQAAVARQHVPVPAAPQQAVALAEQEAVAGVVRRARIVAPGRLVEERERAEVAAVVDLVEEAVVAAVEVLGPQQHEVAREGHQTAVVAGRQAEIDDRAHSPGGPGRRRSAAGRRCARSGRPRRTRRRRPKLTFDDLDALDRSLGRQRGCHHHAGEQKCRSQPIERHTSPRAEFMVGTACPHERHPRARAALCPVSRDQSGSRQRGHRTNTPSTIPAECPRHWRRGP